MRDNIAWARRTIKAIKGNNVTAAELDTIVYVGGGIKCYFIQWRGMTLGLELDGHLHS